MKWQRLSQRFRREPTLVSNPEKESLEKVEKQLKDAEDRRTKSFRNSLTLLEFDFLQAESDRNFPEKTRQLEFDKAQTERRERFTASEARQLDLFREADLEQEKIFRSSEERRIATFSNVQVSRKTMMQECLESHQKQNDWAITVINTLYTEGHRYRETVCRKTLQAVSNDFDSFLRSVQESLSTTHSHRIDTLQTHLSIGSSNDETGVQLSTDIPRYAQHRHSTDSTVCASEPRHSMNSRPESSGKTPLRVSQILGHPDHAVSESIPPLSEHELQSIHHHTKMPKSSCPFSSTSPAAHIPSISPVPDKEDHQPGALAHSQLPAVVLPRPPTVHTTHDYPTLTSTLLTSYTAYFRRREVERDVNWEKALKGQEEVFRAAEAKRAMAKNLRQEEFHAAERTFEKHFNARASYFSAQFDERKASRDGAEAHRDREFKALIDLCRRGLERLSSAFAAQATAVAVAETHAFMSIQEQPHILFSRMGRVVWDTRRELNKIFIQSLQAYGLQCDPIPIPSLPSSRILEKKELEPSHSAPLEPLFRIPTIRTTCDKMIGTLQIPSESAETSFVHDPSSGKAQPLPHTYRERSHTSDTLQTNSHSYPQEEMHIHNVETYLEELQYRFTEAERQRRARATNEFQRWQQEFALNERKRKRDYGIQQTQHESRVKKREERQNSSFLDSQETRAKEFLSGERDRENNFWVKETHRMGAWDTAAQDETRLARVREDALICARADESEREKEFTGWTTTVQEGFMRKVMVWKEDFAYDERQREQQVKAILDRIAKKA